VLFSTTADALKTAFTGLNFSEIDYIYKLKPAAVYDVTLYL